MYKNYWNEHWEFNDQGLISIRDMSANDYSMNEQDRRYWIPIIFESEILARFITTIFYIFD